MKVSPHTHFESPLTGSTIATFIKKAKELGRTHVAYTDLGHLSSSLKVYKQANEAGLKYIPGLEFYFKDTTCPYVGSTSANRCRYFTASIYCQDQQSYQELCRIVSRTDFPTTEIYEEPQQLWAWKDLEHMSKFNTILVLGGIHCMVGKTLLSGNPDAAKNIFLKLKSLFKEKLFTSLICEPWTKKWNSVVVIELLNDSSVSCLASDLITTDRARRFKASDLTERYGHKTLKSILSNGILREINVDIKSAKIHKGFLPLPGGDALLAINEFLLDLSENNNVPILVSDYAYYASKEDKIVQTMRLEGNNKLQPNLYMKSEEEARNYLKTTMELSDGLIQRIFDNSELFISHFSKLELKYDWRLADSGPNPMAQISDIIKKNGRMKWDDPKYVSRLREELEVIVKNPKKDLSPYFLPIYDVLNHYKENGLLTGPGRGSAGGSLLCYLLGITQVNPFKYDLPFQRFFSLDRIMGNELPDIDSDFEDRELLVGKDGHSGYLYKKYGDKAAQISTRHTLRLKSTIKDTNRYFKGKVEQEIEVFSKGLPDPPQGVSDHAFVFGIHDEEHPEKNMTGLIEQNEDMQRYIENRPEEWEIVSKAMGLTRAFSKHASAFVIADVPIKDVVPTKDVHVTQYEAAECGFAGLIKYDFLVLKQLKDIRVCMDLINKKNGKYRNPGRPEDVVGWRHAESDSIGCANCYNVKELVETSHGTEVLDVVSRDNAYGICDKCATPLAEVKVGHEVGYFDHKGVKTYVWDLPEVQEVFQSIWSGNCQTIFQIHTKAMVPFVIEIQPGKLMDIATILALVRPGPLDYIDPETGRNMAEEYIERKRGRSVSNIKELTDALPETFGIFAFQEDLGKIARDLAGFPGPKAEKLRSNMAKKKMEKLMEMKPAFIEGASKHITVEVAEKIWEQMVTFGRYGFSIIHSVEYALITYASMFFMHHYPLEWWAAILTNAEEQEITQKFWPYVRELVAAPDINLSTDTMVVDYANEKIRAKFGIVRGVGEATIGPIVEGRPYKDIQDYVDKDVAGQSLSHKLIHVGILDSLFPPKANLLEKLKMYEDALEKRKFTARLAKATKEGKKLRANQAKEGVIPEGYVNLHPIKEAAMKKSVLPSLPVNLFELGKNYSKALIPDPFRAIVLSNTDHQTRLVDGNSLQRLDEIDSHALTKDVYVACTCYVVNADEFSYPKKNPTKRALKLILDADGFVKEYVLWPDYNSGQLIYPPELVKGSIATVFFRKKVGKPDMNITGVVVET